MGKMDWLVRWVRQVLLDTSVAMENKDNLVPPVLQVPKETTANQVDQVLQDR